MPCPHCEAPLIGDSASCPECGLPLRSAPAPTPGGQPAGPAAQPGQPRPAAQPAQPAPQVLRVAPVRRPAAMVIPGRPATPPGTPAQPAQPVQAAPPAAGQDIWGPLGQTPTAAAAAARPDDPPIDPNDPTPSLIERTELPDVPDVPIEQMPGMIDQRLFGAFVPEHLPTEPMAGLEEDSVENIEVTLDPVPGLEQTSQLDGSPQQAVFASAEAVPDVIDQRLFGAFVPPDLETPTMEGVVHMNVESRDRLRARAAKLAADEKGLPLAVCHQCGTERKSVRCPVCGSPMVPHETEE